MKTSIHLKALSLMLIFVFIVSGCQRGDSSTEGTSEQPKELTLWTWKVAYVPGFEAAAEKFEEKTGISVTVESFTPDDTYKQKVMASANSGNLPDIVHYWGTKNDSIENVLVELSQEFDESVREGFFSTAFNPILVTEDDVQRWQNDDDASEVQKSLEVGNLYGVPLDIGGFFTFYGNKKLIEEAGLEAKAPETWEEYVEMMKTIKEKTGVPGLVFGAKLPDVWENWSGSALSIMANGPEGYNALLKREAKMSDPENLRVIKALETLAEEDLLMPGILSTDIDGGDQAFANEQAAFVLGGSFTMSTLLAMGMEQDDFIAFSVPPLENSKIDTWSIDPFTLTMLSVSKDSSAQEAAVDFVKFITTDPEGAIAFANNGYTVPAIDLKDNASELTANLESIVESFSPEPGPYSEVEPNINLRGDHTEWSLYYQELQKMMEGKTTAEDVAKAFDDAAAKGGE